MINSCHEQPFASDILTLKEVARYMQISTTTVYVLAQMGRMPGAFKLGGRWRFKRSMVDGYFEAGKRKI